jgi:hypothetical protein
MGMGAGEADCGKPLAMELKPSARRDPAKTVATQNSYLIFKKRSPTDDCVLNRNVYWIKGYTPGEPNTNEI